MEIKRKQPLGIELVRRGVVNGDAIEKALQYQTEHPNKRLGDILYILKEAEPNELAEEIGDIIGVKGIYLTDGKIKIDGKDINQIPIETLRNNICYITQDNFLFSSTLKENISLFRDEYDDEEIKESTKKAIVYEDIKKMPKGIETVIGERGGDLSGGQKQRVSISRAFLKESRILIFDDTFSALDNRTSEKLIENIKELSSEKTCIIISNKVSDVKYSDKIIVLDKGNIVEEGTHEQLIQNEGIYSGFYNQQSTKAEPSFLV